MRWVKGTTKPPPPPTNSPNKLVSKNALKIQISIPQNFTKKPWTPYRGLCKNMCYPLPPIQISNRVHLHLKPLTQSTKTKSHQLLNCFTIFYLKNSLFYFVWTFKCPREKGYFGFLFLFCFVFVFVFGFFVVERIVLVWPMWNLFYNLPRTYYNVKTIYRRFHFATKVHYDRYFQFNYLVTSCRRLNIIKKFLLLSQLVLIETFEQYLFTFCINNTTTF